MLQDFWCVSDHFGTLCIKGLKQEIFFISIFPKMESFVMHLICSFDKFGKDAALLLYVKGTSF